MAAPDHIIWIVTTRLSDGSTAYAVELPDGKTRIDAISEDDAHDMAGKIADAILAHSNETAGVREAA